MSDVSHPESSKSISIAEISEGPRNQRSKRSSIFRPHLTATVKEETFYNALPQDYIDKLNHENFLWKATYAVVRDEYCELRKQTKKKEVCVEGAQLEHSSNLVVYENYVKKAEDFIDQVNCVVELHKNACKYLALRKRQLNYEVQASRQSILKALQGKPNPD